MDWWTRLIWWTYRHAWFNTDLDISLKHSPEWYIDASFPYVYLHSDYNDIGDGDDNGDDDDDDDADISDGDYDDIDIKDEFLMFLPSLTAFCSWFTKMQIDDNFEDDGDDDDDDSDDDDLDIENEFPTSTNVFSLLWLPFVHDFAKRYRRTDGWTGRRTDRPFYRDARTHLEICSYFASWYPGPMVPLCRTFC